MGVAVQVLLFGVHVEADAFAVFVEYPVEVVEAVFWGGEQGADGLLLLGCKLCWHVGRIVAWGGGVVLLRWGVVEAGRLLV